MLQQTTGSVYNILIRRDVYQRIYPNERNFHKSKTYHFLTKFAKSCSKIYTPAKNVKKGVTAKLFLI